MPVHITKFPSKDFKALFEEAAANVWSYFDNAWIISKAVRAEKKLKTANTTGSAKGAKPKTAMPPQKAVKSKGSTPVIERFMQELEASESFVRQAKQCGDVFDDYDVKSILELCEEHGLLPSRDLFIQLVPVPSDKLMTFATEVISQRLSTRDITLRRIERFGRTSKGTKKPAAPTTRFEAKEQAIKLTSRSHSWCETMVAAAAPKKRRSRATGFTVPATILPHVKTLMTEWAAIVKILEEDDASGKSAA